MDEREREIYRSIMFLTPAERKARKEWQRLLAVQRVIDERAVDAILRGEPDPEIVRAKAGKPTIEEIDNELAARGAK